jgi:D-alanyl-D-alanine carboxypeptidase
MPRILPLLALILPFSALASVDDAVAFLEETYAADRPGASVIVMKDGQTLHEAGYGLANVEWGIPITPDTVFRVGSITKQFTGAAIMLLEQRGLLSVDDPITRHLPDYPTHGHQITIEHLLNHTSGIRSYTGIDGYMGNPVRLDVSTEELVEIFKNLPMDFAPGDAWLYNNSGYVLLGAIIEKVSGKSYEEFIADNIATPLELDSTFYGGPKLIPSRAAGYAIDDRGNIVNAGFISMTQPHAAGSLLSTTRDLAEWHKALTGGEFIHDDSYARMTAPADLNDGESYPYGYGLGIGQLRERRMIAHGGGIHGFTCYVLWLPDEDIYVAVLTNGAAAGPGPSTVARKVAAMVLDDPYPEREAVPLSAADHRGLAGEYAGAGLPPIEISTDDGKIVMTFGDENAETLYAESREILFMEDSIAYLAVEWDGETAARLLFHFEEGVPPDVAERITD